MKLGLLVPRYGVEVVGGTEHWLRLLCEHLAADRGWAVEVWTTCAVSAATWADEYPAGTVSVHGVTVHRHRSESGRNPDYLHQLPRLRRDPGAWSDVDAMDYIRLVGPVCPDAAGAAVDAAAGGALDLLAVTPYLYWPTVTAVPRAGRRVIFHGAAHDEPELYLPIMGDVFQAVGGFAFNSYAERELVERRFQVGHLPSRVIGNAVDEGHGDPARARAALGLDPDEPFVLCLGRVERAKGSEALAALWRTYAERRSGAGRLVFLGPDHETRTEPAGGPVVRAGRQPDEVKWGALAACELLIAPSAQESFSLVVLEAWLAGRPVLVNGRCGPTVEHCRRSGGGVWFEQYGDFEAGLDRLLGDPSLRHEMGARGGAYARREFAWPRILDRYEDLARTIVGRRG
ncbi:MAG TPA: glycosyltransferase family 4 protein [Acidimicrobiales bacterium]|nr:glycosyltransferase family 4 protein [Acidimicrobiales bacterium]